MREDGLLGLGSKEDRQFECLPARHRVCKFILRRQTQPE